MKRYLILTVTLFLFAAAAFAQSNSGSSSTESTKSKAFRPTKTQITEAQTKLKAAGKYSGDADGKYNDAFRESLKVYQEQNALDKNGRLDEATLVKMGIALTDSQKGIESNAADSKPKRTVFRVNKEQITAVQKMLKVSGSYKGEPTGKYDDDFRAAIKEYQAANGLAKSGSLNRATLEKLGIALTDTQTAIAVNPDDLSDGKSTGEPKKRGPVFRATAEQITEVQKMLKDKGLYTGAQTGKLDDDTRTGIRGWQKQNGVKETGTLNKVTLEAMKIELTEKQKTM